MKLEVFISWSSCVFLNNYHSCSSILVDGNTLHRCSSIVIFNTLHIQYDRTRLDIAMRHSDFPASGAKSQSHARPSWSKAIEHLECGGCLSLDPTGAGQQIHGCWGRIHQVEPRDVGESQFWRALRYDLVMLELGISTSQWRHVCSRCITLLRPVWFFWFLCQGYHSWRMGSTKISQIHLKSKGWTKNSPLKTHSPGKLPDSQVMKFPLKLRGVNFGS